MADAMSLQSCVMQGQTYAAEWLAEHPKWLLSGWRCEKNVPREEPT